MFLIGTWLGNTYLQKRNANKAKLAYYSNIKRPNWPINIFKYGPITKHKVPQFKKSLKLISKKFKPSIKLIGGSDQA